MMKDAVSSVRWETEDTCDVNDVDFALDAGTEKDHSDSSGEFSLFNCNGWGSMSDIDDEKDEASSSDQTQDEEIFLALPPKRASKSNFPPTCPVLVCQDYKEFSGSKMFRQGVVVEAGINLDDRQSMYKVQMNDNAEVLPVKEPFLHFCRGTPVWHKTGKDEYQESVVLGSQENAAPYDDLGLQLFPVCLPQGPIYSIQLLSIKALLAKGNTGILHGVPQNAISFRPDPRAVKSKSITENIVSFTSQTTGAGAIPFCKPMDSLVLAGQIPLANYLNNGFEEQPLLGCLEDGKGATPLLSRVSTDSTTSVSDDSKPSGSNRFLIKGHFNAEKPVATVECLGKQKDKASPTSWADMVTGQPSKTTEHRHSENSSFALICKAKNATKSPKLGDRKPTWDQRLKTANQVLERNSVPEPYALTQLTKKGRKKKKNGHGKIGKKVDFHSSLKQGAGGREVVGITQSKPSISKSIELPSAVFGKKFLINAINGKNGSKLKDLIEKHGCDIDFYEEVPEGCSKHTSLMALIVGPSILKISECSLAIEEALYYAVPPALRGYLLVKLGLYNDYREVQSSIVWSHNPFPSPNNFVLEDCKCVSTGGYLRHIAVVKAGPLSKPLQEVIGFADASQWKDDLKHRFPTCQIEIVDGSNYRGGFPALCSHLVLSSAQFSEVFECRKELLARLQRKR